MAKICKRLVFENLQKNLFKVAITRYFAIEK